MSSRDSARRGSQRPRVSSVPPHVSTSGPDATAVAATAGLHLDEWQQVVVDGGLSEKADGRWAASEVGCWVPRQNGKGGVIEAVVLAHLFLFGAKLIVWSAHEYRTAEQGFRRLQALIEDSPHLSKRVEAIREANGEQRVELPDGRRVQFNTRSKRALRGFTGDVLILDEAQELTEGQMAAILPTISARSLEVPGPQVWYFGTPPDDPTAWVYELRESGQRGDPDLAWFDWGLDLTPDEGGQYEPAALSSPESWYAANPAMGVRIAEDAARRELGRLGQSFARERLGAWLPRLRPGDGVIPAALWAELEDRDATRPELVTFAVDVNPSRSHSAIAWAGRDGDGLLVGVSDYRPGTHWVVERLVHLRERWNPVAVGLDVKGPAGSLEVDLEEAGFARPQKHPFDGGEDPKHGDLWVPSATEVASAFGWFVDAAKQRRLTHVGDAPLSVAVAGAATRSLVGGSAWDRKAGVDISPLCAATTALGALLCREAVASDVNYDLTDSVF